MPQGDKSSHADKQKRHAAHIEEGYEKKGLNTKNAEAMAWATVNKLSGGGKKGGSGRKHDSLSKGTGNDLSQIFQFERNGRVKALISTVRV